MGFWISIVIPFIGFLIHKELNY